MGAARRAVRFGSGGLLGAGLGTAVAILFAPQSGEELKGRILDRIRQARLAGAQAKAEKEAELIRKFRQDVGDDDAFQEEEAQARLGAAQAVAAVGLGLNAPGALAAQEPALRADRDPVAVPPTVVPPATADESAST